MKQLRYGIGIIMLSALCFADGVIYGEFVDSKNYKTKTTEKGIQGQFVSGYLDKKNSGKKRKTSTKILFKLGKGSGSGIYVGGSNTAIASRKNAKVQILSNKDDQVRQLGLAAKVGYNLNDFLGVETRVNFGLLDKHEGTKFQNIALYLKPNVNITDTINIYGLFGYGKSNLHGSTSGTGLSYGYGIKYDFLNYVGVYWDAINYLDKEDTNSMWGYSLGLEYQFKE